MNDFETNIECCYLGVIPVKILKERLNFKDISDYLFAKELLKIAENLRNSDAVHLAFLIFDDYILQEEDFGLLDIFFSDWHDAHEDIVFTVSRIRNCNLVEFFKKLSISSQVIWWKMTRMQLLGKPFLAWVQI
ncbi:hypothetical protein MWF93_08720 [Acinetobacter baumannii]|nr:hypothetical protein [Acinetobacter baumannii]